MAFEERDESSSEHNAEQPTSTVGDRVGDVHEATDIHAEIGDPGLEAMGRRIVERTPSWKVAAVFVVAIVVGGGALFAWANASLPPPLPRLEETTVRELAAQLDRFAELPPHRRRAAAGRALGLIEADRVAEPLLRALVDGGRRTEFSRLELLETALSDPDVAPLWRDLCPVDFDLAEVARTEASGPKVFEQCDLHQMELVMSSRVITTPAIDLLVAHAIYRHLADHDALTEVEERALVMMSEGSVNATRAPPFH